LTGLAGEAIEAPHTSDSDYRFIESCFADALELFDRVSDLDEVATVLRFQFENFDGSGQPSGFSHEQIPLHARILSVANAFDTLTAPRNGDFPVSVPEALRKLLGMARRQFDDSIVNVLCSLKAPADDSQQAQYDYERELVAA